MMLFVFAVMSRNSFDNGGSVQGLPLDSTASLSTTPARRLSSESMRGQPQLYFNYSQVRHEIHI